MWLLNEQIERKREPIINSRERTKFRCQAEFKKTQKRKLNQDMSEILGKPAYSRGGSVIART